MSIHMNKEGKEKNIVQSIDRFGNEEERIWATSNGAHDLLCTQEFLLSVLRPHI